MTRHTFLAILPSMGDRGSKRRHIRRFEPVEWSIVELALAQHAVVALWQLVELGLSPRAVRDRVAAGRLHRIHRGVYAVGTPRLTKEGRYMAAVLACGQRSALSHRSAADHRGLARTSRARVDVVSPRRPGRSRDGIDAHTSASLLTRDVEVVDAIPCTSVARTLLDLAAVVARRVVERAFDEAEVLRVLDVRAVEDVLARARGHRGAGVLRAVLAEHAPGSTPTRSALEEAFLAICRAAGLPRPEVNAWIALEPGGYTADFLFREQRLVVETDGRHVHATSRAFEHDRRRDQRLMLAGFAVVRFTWSQVTSEPRVVEATVRALLQASMSPRRIA